MIADLKPYAEYKESGLPWLGHVPAHWEVRKPRHIGSLLKGVGGTKEDALSAGVPCVRYGELYTTHTYFVRRPKTFIHPDRAADYTPLHYGDVLFAASGETLEEIGKSAVSLIEGTAVCGGDVIILRPTVPVHAPFLGYVMDCRPSANQKATMGRGTTVKHIYPDELKHFLFPLPPVPEQAAIVRFLDWANGRLERAIRAKRKVIVLLNEQKQAIIHRAVTRGLDPSVPLKPSGIPWLGDIPQHWEVRRVKQATRILRGKFSHRPRNDASLYDGRYPFIQTGVVAQASKFITSHSQTLNEKGLAVSKLFPSGTLVMTIAANIGEVAVLTFDACFPDSIVGFVPSASADRDYLYMVFLCMKPELLREAPVNTQGNLNVERIGAMGMPFPPLCEQTEIAKRAEAETVAFDAGIGRLEREIELLREYRIRLVADVVTGKLDVREAAARLPHEAPPDTAEDDSEPSLDPEVAYDEAVT
jgi:type I restriction enzyme, S subunit